MPEQITTNAPALGIALMEPSTKMVPNAPPKKAHGGAFCSPRNPDPTPPNTPVATTHERIKAPEKNEIDGRPHRKTQACVDRALNRDADSGGDHGQNGEKTHGDGR